MLASPVTYFQSRCASRVRCFVGYIITLRLANGEVSKDEARGVMSRKFADDFPESVIRRSAGTRASFVSIKRPRGITQPGKCVRYVKMEHGGGDGERRWLANALNNTAATIGRILMTLPALARDNRNGFIRFTYTPHDLSAFRASDR